MTKLVILGRKSKTGNYEAFFRALPAQIVTTLVPGEVISCDALILPGGGDITPAFFGEKNKGSRTVDTELDILQFQALDIAIAAGIPVIGICKGMQVINVAFGGTIIQDMPEDCLHSSPSGDVFHDTIMVDDSHLFKYFPVKRLRKFTFGNNGVESTHDVLTKYQTMTCGFNIPLFCT